MTAGNSVTIVGNATRDPELRFTSGGSAVCGFGVAFNRRWQNKSTSEWEEDVSYFNVECWNDLAENVAETLSKGMRVTITGRLDQQTWETDDGDKREKVVIVADDVAPSLRFATADVTKAERGDSKPAKKPARRSSTPVDEDPF